MSARFAAGWNVFCGMENPLQGFNSCDQRGIQPEWEDGRCGYKGIPELFTEITAVLVEF